MENAKSLLIASMASGYTYEMGSWGLWFIDHLAKYVPVEEHSTY